ncbi:protein strawberry notch homolog 2 isoform X1 [Rana temporaria]|uniref:protein strawberry notch homolog 2 isoform X1 n=1 Tax=Rana temporaria TaxID=8407 RepID=UPI001AADE025|nr:protein strawberry notch homolog 2 isoform X1 [Rana temporaria]XP_040179853.1 protein strawberry notch homolog 2 isoform X1 [Rana temporaria]
MPCTVSVMEGGGSYSQPELQHGASGMCSTAAMQYQPSQLEIEAPALAGTQWTHYPYSPAHCLPHAPLTSSDSLQFNGPTEYYSRNFSTPFSSCFTESQTYIQDPINFLNDFSSRSALSSPDSLSGITDTDDFLPADSLNSLPTIWDVNTPTQDTSTSLFPTTRPFTGFNRFEDFQAIIRTPPPVQQRAPNLVEEEEEDEDAEELGHAETYADYVPSKSKIGIQHPDRVVETSTLSSVPPPDVTYTLSLPCSIIDRGLLSALQLEAIVYACQQHEVILPSGQRAGFLIGDGAGVGKGRTVAGIILENYRRGRKKALWFSVSNDLRCDSERDLRDIDASCIPVHALSKIKYGDTSASEGVLFATYSALIGESQAGGQHRTRIKQIRDWCGENFDGVIVFDECHKAKNASCTKMGRAVLELQNNLPLARVVYASATGASEPKNMIYMSRLGIWGEGTSFSTFDEFLHAIEKRGVGAMEIVAMDMKVSGMYIARQLSFTGVNFRIEEIPLNESYKQMYNRAALLWAEALTVFQTAADWLGLESRKSLWAQFWSSHQRFFKYLCIAAKVQRLVTLAHQELSKGKCIVIGLQSTGEARTREVMDENDGHLDHFVSAAEGVFRSLIMKHFPSTKRKREKGMLKRKKRGKPRTGKFSRCDLAGLLRISEESSSDSDGVLDSDSNSSPESLQDNDDVIFVEHTLNGLTIPDRGPEQVEQMKMDLLAKVEELGKELPLNTLDMLIDQFGGPEKVAEMTGRKGRVVHRSDGSLGFDSRAEQNLSIDNINLREKERFMNGSKLVAIISEASSSGISLQADRRVPNQRRRVHMTLELPWSADRAIQQFGRTHRSNQVSAPEYVFLISELAGERRFASIVAKRLESLGALTHGDRRATESRDLSKYNFENKYGSRSLEQILSAILNQTQRDVPPPQGYPGGPAAFFQDMKQGLLSVGICCRETKYNVVVDKECSVTKFLNRMLGLEVHKQNSLFQFFTDTFDFLIEKDKKDGKYDMGILDLAPGVDEIYQESKETFLTPGHPQDGQVVFYKISVDRGLNWEKALEKESQLHEPEEGFYLSYKVRGEMYSAVLAEHRHGKSYNLYKPNIGKQSHPETLDSLRNKYYKVSPEEAQHHWESQYIFSLSNCSHTVWNGNCKMVQQGKECIQGLRLRHYYMLCGSLLRVWSRMASVISDITSSSYLQIVRLKTKDKHKQVGIQIPEPCVYKVREELKQMDMNVKRKHEESKQSAERLSMPPMLSGPSALDLSLPFFHPPSLSEHDVLDLTCSPLPSNMQEQSGYHFSDSLVGILSPSETLQSQQFNVREIIEEMLQKLKAPDASAAERQSVIQFGGENDFWETG